MITQKTLLVVTPRGRYHSQHEAACGAERLFQCLWCAQTSRAMFPHARAQSCCHVEARTRLRRTPHFFTLTVTASLAKCEVPILLLQVRFGFLPTARSYSSGFAWTRTTGLLWSRRSCERERFSRAGQLRRQWIGFREALCRRGFMKTSAWGSLRGKVGALVRKTALGSIRLAARRCAACSRSAVLMPAALHVPRRRRTEKLLQCALARAQNSWPPHSRVQN